MVVYRLILLSFFRPSSPSLLSRSRDVYKRQFYASKAMLVCPKCGKPTRLAHKILEDGSKKRLCKKCAATF